MDITTLFIMHESITKISLDPDVYKSGGFRNIYKGVVVSLSTSDLKHGTPAVVKKTKDNNKLHSLIKKTYDSDLLHTHKIVRMSALAHNFAQQFENFVPPELGLFFCMLRCNSH